MIPFLCFLRTDAGHSAKNRRRWKSPSVEIRTHTKTHPQKSRIKQCHRFLSPSLSLSAQLFADPHHNGPGVSWRTIATMFCCETHSSRTGDRGLLTGTKQNQQRNGKKKILSNSPSPTPKQNKKTRHKGTNIKQHPNQGVVCAARAETI